MEEEEKGETAAAVVEAVVVTPMAKHEARATAETGGTGPGGRGWMTPSHWNVHIPKSLPRARFYSPFFAPPFLLPFLSLLRTP